jgi:carotenoid cleavage dioxygenase-like enzyme
VCSCLTGHVLLLLLLPLPLCYSQQVEEVEAAVQGSIPPWLSGSLVMNGGGEYTPMRHLFDGYGLLSKVRLLVVELQMLQRVRCTTELVAEMHVCNKLDCLSPLNPTVCTAILQVRLEGGRALGSQRYNNTTVPSLLLM